MKRNPVSASSLTLAASCSIVSLLAMVIAGPAVGQDGSFQMPPARVEVAAAELREMAPSVDVSGTVVSLNDSRIASEVQGVLTWLAEVGDDVNAGDVIARIDPRIFRIVPDCEKDDFTSGKELRIKRIALIM